MADDDYKLGSMDITQHNRTWGTFMKLSTYGSVIVLGLVFVLMFLFS